MRQAKPDMHSLYMGWRVEGTHVDPHGCHLARLQYYCCTRNGQARLPMVRYTSGHSDGRIVDLHTPLSSTPLNTTSYLFSMVFRCPKSNFAEERAIIWSFPYFTSCHTCRVLPVRTLKTEAFICRCWSSIIKKKSNCRANGSGTYLYFAYMSEEGRSVGSIPGGARFFFITDMCLYSHVIQREVPLIGRRMKHVTSAKVRR